jgi:hypothetical protein
LPNSRRADARQVNNWARGRAVVPRWAAVLAITLEELPAEALDLLREEVRFSCHEVLGIATNADVPAIRRAMARLALIRDRRRAPAEISVRGFGRGLERLRVSFVASCSNPHRKPSGRTLLPTHGLGSRIGAVGQTAARH